MSTEVARLEDLISHYIGVLDSKKSAKKEIESWGLDVDRELAYCKEAHKDLANLLVDGINEIG